MERMVVGGVGAQFLEEIVKLEHKRIRCAQKEFGVEGGQWRLMSFCISQNWRWWTHVLKKNGGGGLYGG